MLFDCCSCCAWYKAVIEVREKFADEVKDGDNIFEYYIAPYIFQWYEIDYTNPLISTEEICWECLIPICVFKRHRQS